MFPSLSKNNHRDILERDAVLGSKLLLSDPAGCVSTTNVGNDDRGHLRNWAVLANQPRLSTFGYLVIGIVPGSAEEQVCRVDTAGPVAVVQHPQPIRNGSVVNLPRRSMSLERFSIATDDTISVVIPTPLPVPAIIHGTGRNVGPKPLFEGAAVLDSPSLLALKTHGHSALVFSLGAECRAWKEALTRTTVELSGAWVRGMLRGHLRGPFAWVSRPGLYHQRRVISLPQLYQKSRSYGDFILIGGAS